MGSFSQEVASIIIRANTTRFLTHRSLKGEFIPALWRDIRFTGKVPFRGFRGKRGFRDDIASSRENVFIRIKFI